MNLRPALIIFDLAYLISTPVQAQTDICDPCFKIFNAGKDQEAADCITKTLSEHPEFNSCLYYFRAYSYYHLVKYDSAKKDIQEIISHINTKEVSEYALGNSYFLLARINSKEKNVPEEMRLLLKAAEHTRSADLLLTIGYAYIKLKKYALAVSYLDSAITSDPQSDRAYNNRALAYIKLNRLEEAAVDLDSAMLHNPKNPYIYKHRGLLYLKRGERTAACLDFMKSIDLGYREYGNEADKEELDLLIKDNCR